MTVLEEVLAVLLEVSELLLEEVLEAVDVLEVVPPPCSRYPPTAAMTRATARIPMAAIVETPVLERRITLNP